MTITIVGGGNPSGPTYPLQRSVRLRSSASAYFNRTPASTTNQKTFTWSGWVKRGSLDGSYVPLFGSKSNGTSLGYLQTFFGFYYNTLFFNTSGSAGGQVLNCQSSGAFRDPSAWYHIVLAIDTTQATSANGMKLYVNGILQSFQYVAYTQNAVSYVTSTNPTYIGLTDYPSNIYFDGYLTEVNFIDGQALTPTSFGAYNSYGVWSPAKYTGTYGTNGFYLNFQDNSGATATTIGKDSSGNNNNWTPNNISVTAGVTYDSMVDVPTNTSTTNANFCTINPLGTGVPAFKNSTSLTISDGNLSYSKPSGTGYFGALGTFAMPPTGKWYWEFTPTTNVITCGISVGADYASSGEFGVRVDNATILVNGSSVQTGLAGLAVNDVIGCAWNADSNSFQFYKNGSTYGTAVSFTPASGASYYPYLMNQGTGLSVVANANFGQRPFSYTPPTGFKSLNTFNLPTPTIPNGALYMAATTYTGTGASLSVSNAVNSVSFQPDFVWVKGRSVGYDHFLYDSVRGTLKNLSSNLTAAEQTVASSLTSFNSNGFTLGGGTASINANGTTYVGWQWKASNTTAVTNTSGSIPSTISANTTSGFSIVSFNSGAAGNKTVGHGLGVAPSFWIIRTRNGVNNWSVGSRAFGNPQDTYVSLNTTGVAVGGDTRIWANAAPTSSVLSFESNYTVVASTDCIAYCFSEISGYSKFGGFFGNGSTDGTFVYLGFRPRYIMYKPVTTAGSWDIRDTSRSTYNANDLELYANLSNAEASAGVNIDILSNGFKIRNSNATYNGNGIYYIYMAFAENPFNYSLAR